MQYTVPFWARDGLGGAEPGIVTLSSRKYKLFHHQTPHASKYRLRNHIIIYQISYNQSCSLDSSLNFLETLVSFLLLLLLLFSLSQRFIGDLYFFILRLKVLN